MNNFEKILLKKLLENDQIMKTYIEEYDSFFYGEGDGKIPEFQKALNNIKSYPLYKEGGYLVLNQENSVEEDLKIYFGQLPEESELTFRIERREYRNNYGVSEKLYLGYSKFTEKTYSSRLFIRIRTVHKKEVISDEWIYFLSMRIMVFSKACNHRILYEQNPEAYNKIIEEKGEELVDYQNAGYFVMNGNEKTLISLEKLLPNLFLINKEYSENKKIKSLRLEYYSLSKYYSTLFYLTYHLTSKGIEIGTTYNIIQKLRLFFILKELGMEDDEILQRTNTPYSLLVMGQQMESYYKEKEYFNEEGKMEIEKYLYKKYKIINRRSVLDYYLDYSLLRHLGNSSKERYLKAVFLCFSIKYLLRDPENILQVDKDDTKNKLILTPTKLVSMLLLHNFKELLQEIKQKLDKNILPKNAQKQYVKLFKSNGLTNKIYSSFNIGVWPDNNIGVSQLLDGHNRNIRISSLRRISSNLDENLSFLEAREINVGSYGRTCMVDTRDGANIGLLKSFAIGAKVSSNEDLSEKDIRALTNFEGVGRISKKDVYTEVTLLFLDGVPIAEVLNREKYIEDFFVLRRGKDFSANVGISHDKINKKIEITSIGGRLIRPVFSIQNKRYLLTIKHLEGLRNNEISYKELVKQKVVEHIDAKEESDFEILFGLFESKEICRNCYREIFLKVSIEEEVLNQDKKEITKECHKCNQPIVLRNLVTDKTKYVEYHAMCSVGLLTSTIPYLNHTRSHRALLGVGVTRQAISKKQNFSLFRFETKNMFMQHTHKRVVTTDTIDYFDLGNYGINSVVAIMGYEGATIEDALVINKSAVERGFGYTMLYKNFKEACAEYNFGQKETFKRRENISINKALKFSNINEDGLRDPGKKYSRGAHIIIGKVSPAGNTQTTNIEQVDASREHIFKVRHSVERVILYQNQKGGVSVVVNLKEAKDIEVGDKFAARYGQKGILSSLVEQRKLPFTLEGVIREIFFDPHGIPTRMAYLQLMELQYGRQGAVEGEKINLSAFSKVERAKIEIEETMYIRETSGVLHQKIGLGVAYYMRLHHLASEKIFSRGKGPIQILNKQRTEGKSRKGGLRFGEMERDCLISYGASALLRDRVIDESDLTSKNFCVKCKKILFGKNREECNECDSKDNIGTLDIRYSFILLLKELISSGIQIELDVKNKYE